MKAFEKLAKAVSKTADDFADGSVVRWKALFEDGGTVYTYAAIKAKNRWYVTGPTSARSGITYDKLVETLASEFVFDIQAATEWIAPVKEQSPRAKLAAATDERCGTCRGHDCGCSDDAVEWRARY